MKVEKLKRIVVNQNSGVGKIVVVIGGIICVVAFVACKKQCYLNPKEGFKIVGDDKNCYYDPIKQPETCVEERRNEAMARDSLKYWQNQKELACAELRHVLDSISAIEPAFANAINGCAHAYGPVDSLPTIDCIISAFETDPYPVLVRLCTVARKAKQAWESYLAWLEKHGISTALLEDCQKQNGSR